MTSTIEDNGNQLGMSQSCSLPYETIPERVDSTKSVNRPRAFDSSQVRCMIFRTLEMKAKDRGKGIAGGDGKKLKDYPSVPGTPPPVQKKDEEVAWLERELDREKIYLSVLQKENKEIEKILQDLEKEVNYVKSHFPQNLDGDGKIHADNEHWFKYEAQMEVNRKLEREKRRLESEIKQMEDQGMINLDSLTQSELLLYVKQLERTKTDLLSDLRAKEWSLDKQAKDFHHLSETKRSLEAQIKHYDGEHALFRHYKRIACPSASVPASRLSSQKSSARTVRFGKQGTGGKKLSSQSQENLCESAKGEVMYRSLDEGKLNRASPVHGDQRRMNKSEVTEDKIKQEAKEEGSTGVEPHPELTQQTAKTPSDPSKTVRSSHNKNRAQPSDRSSSPSISALVTEESDVTETDASSPYANGVSRTESGIGSPSDYAEEYEDDFEDSDAECRKELKSGEDEVLKIRGENKLGNSSRRV